MKRFRHQPGRPRRRSAAPGVERVEARRLLATITVTTAQDETDPQLLAAAEVPRYYLPEAVVHWS